MTDMVFRVTLFVWIAAALVAGFLWAPLVPGLGATTRVLYFHIPAAWITVVALGWSMLHSVLYLRSRRLEHDDHAAAAAELGLLFCVVATVSGSMWAKAVWHSYWNWDPRETSIVLLLLVYGAYLGLRAAIEEPERRATLSAAYALVAFVTVPFLVFAVPRMYASLHPDTVINARGKVEMSSDIRTVFFSSVIAFTLFFFWMYRLDREASRLTREAERLSENRAAA
jgi:heme exporter protein C